MSSIPAGCALGEAAAGAARGAAEDLSQAKGLPKAWPGGEGGPPGPGTVCTSR